MKEKEYYDFSSPSSYIQVKHNNNNKMLNSKFKQSIFHFLSIYSYLIIFILLFLISSVIFLQINNSHLSKTNRFKRQLSNLNDKQHYTDMLRRILSHRTSSSLLTDCTINMAVDGVYRLPGEHTLASQIIRLIEQTFHNELHLLKRTVDKIRKKLNQSSNSNTEYTLEKFRNEFNLDIRLLLASQMNIKEIDIRIITYDNGGSYFIKYSRKNHSKLDIIDYETINDDIIQQDTILQSFSMSNVRETINNDPQRILSSNGWWIGPVVCEKNKNEAFIMAHVFPISING